MICPSCGQENPEGFRMCGMCGAPLHPTSAARREERKVVTVLFADLVGFTSRSEQLDPEDVRAMLAPYWQRLRSELEHFGGTVEKFIGDAVVALFGAPVAHEDDPERAVRAALAIRDWVTEESELNVRIGVNTGEALVSLGARPSEGEGMASGDVVNTAARLQSAAPVDGILVGEQTYRATERMIEFREHDPIQAKGKAEPVHVWEAVQARSRFGVDLAPAAVAPLVGRDEELELLVAAFRRAADDRIPQLVTVVGVPGIGKSRLLGELFAKIDAGDRLVRWRQGRSLPYGEGVSYWALGEMVKAEAGILETDPSEETTRKLEEALNRLVSDETEAAWLGTLLRPLVGLAADDVGGDRRGEGFAAWRRFFEALGEDRPLVLVFEDLHWADDGLLDFVDHLVDWLTEVPVLVVGTARPELLARRPAWGGGKGNATTISLAPLTDEETARLVHTLLDRSVLAADVQSAVLERAGGNPLYAEEFVRMVAEGGSDDLTFPARCRESSPPVSTRSTPWTRSCSRTLRSSGRCSGRVRSRPSASANVSTSSSGCPRSSVASSCAARVGARSPARASTRSSTSSSATSLTAPSRAPGAPSGTVGRRSGSSRSAGPRTRPTCSRTTIWPRSSCRGPPVWRPACCRNRRRRRCSARASAPPG